MSREELCAPSRHSIWDGQFPDRVSPANHRLPNSPDNREQSKDSLQSFEVFPDCMPAHIDTVCYREPCGRVGSATTEEINNESLHLDTTDIPERGRSRMSLLKWQVATGDRNEVFDAHHDLKHKSRRLILQAGQFLLQNQQSFDHSILKLEEIDTSLASVVGETEEIATSLASVVGETEEIDTSLASVVGETEEIDTSLASVVGETEEIDTSLASVVGETEEIDTSLASVVGETEEIDTSLASVVGETEEIDTSLASVVGETEEIATSLASVVGETEEIATSLASVVGETEEIATSLASVVGETVDQTSTCPCVHADESGMFSGSLVECGGEQVSTNSVEYGTRQVSTSSVEWDSEHVQYSRTFDTTKSHERTNAKTMSTKQINDHVEAGDDLHTIQFHGEADLTNCQCARTDDCWSTNVVVEHKPVITTCEHSNAEDLFVRQSHKSVSSKCDMIAPPTHAPDVQISPSAETCVPISLSNDRDVAGWSRNNKDINRKPAHRKSYSEGELESFYEDEPLEISQLSTRSFDVAELSRSVHESFLSCGGLSSSFSIIDPDNESSTDTTIVPESGCYDEDTLETRPDVSNNDLKPWYSDNYVVNCCHKSALSTEGKRKQAFVSHKGQKKKPSSSDFLDDLSLSGDVEHQNVFSQDMIVPSNDVGTQDTFTEDPDLLWSCPTSPGWNDTDSVSEKTATDVSSVVASPGSDQYDEKTPEMEMSTCSSASDNSPSDVSMPDSRSQLQLSHAEPQSVSRRRGGEGSGETMTTDPICGSLTCERQLEDMDVANYQVFEEVYTSSGQISAKAPNLGHAETAICWSAGEMFQGNGGHYDNVTNCSPTTFESVSNEMRKSTGDLPLHSNERSASCQSTGDLSLHSNERSASCQSTGDLPLHSNERSASCLSTGDLSLHSNERSASCQFTGDLSLHSNERSASCQYTGDLSLDSHLLTEIPTDCNKQEKTIGYSTTTAPSSDVDTAISSVETLDTNAEVKLRGEVRQPLIRHNRKSLSIDLRKLSLLEQTRRRSLPMMRLKSLVKYLPPLTLPSSGVEQDRRFSLPDCVVRREEIQPYRMSQMRVKFEESQSHSFTSFKPNNLCSEKSRPSFAENMTGTSHVDTQACVPTAVPLKDSTMSSDASSTGDPLPRSTEIITPRNGAPADHADAAPGTDETFATRQCGNITASIDPRQDNGFITNMSKCEGKDGMTLKVNGKDNLLECDELRMQTLKCCKVRDSETEKPRSKLMLFAESMAKEILRALVSSLKDSASSPADICRPTLKTAQEQLREHFASTMAPCVWTDENTERGCSNVGLVEDNTENIDNGGMTNSADLTLADALKSRPDVSGFTDPGSLQDERPSQGKASYKDYALQQSTTDHAGRDVSTKELSQTQVSRVEQSSAQDGHLPSQDIQGEVNNADTLRNWHGTQTVAPSHVEGKHQKANVELDTDASRRDDDFGHVLVEGAIRGHQGHDNLAVEFKEHDSHVDTLEEVKGNTSDKLASVRSIQPGSNLQMFAATVPGTQQDSGNVAYTALPVSPYSIHTGRQATDVEATDNDDNGIIAVDLFNKTDDAEEGTITVPARNNIHGFPPSNIDQFTVKETHWQDLERETSTPATNTGIGQFISDLGNLGQDQQIVQPCKESEHITELQCDAGTLRPTDTELRLRAAASRAGDTVVHSGGQLNLDDSIEYDSLLCVDLSTHTACNRPAEVRAVIDTTDSANMAAFPNHGRYKLSGCLVDVTTTNSREEHHQFGGDGTEQITNANITGSTTQQCSLDISNGGKGSVRVDGERQQNTHNRISFETDPTLPMTSKPTSDLTISANDFITGRNNETETAERMALANKETAQHSTHNSVNKTIKALKQTGNDSVDYSCAGNENLSTNVPSLTQLDSRGGSNKRTKDGRDVTGSIYVNVTNNTNRFTDMRGGEEDRWLEEVNSSDTSTPNVSEDLKDGSDIEVDRVAGAFPNLETSSYEDIICMHTSGRRDGHAHGYSFLPVEAAEDTDSLAVNVSESPDHISSLEEHSSLSLCCGGPFKLPLNCTITDRRPEKKLSNIINKSQIHQNTTLGFKLDSLKFHAHHKKAANNQAAGHVVQTFVVNLHELNRNFAGSREELLEELKFTEKSATEDIAQPQDQENTAGDKDDAAVNHTNTEAVYLRGREDGSTDEPPESERAEKEKSEIDEMKAVYESVNNYQSVLQELRTRQGSGQSKQILRKCLQDETSTTSNNYVNIMYRSDVSKNMSSGDLDARRESDDQWQGQTAGHSVQMKNKQQAGDAASYKLTDATRHSADPGSSPQHGSHVYENIGYEPPPVNVHPTTDQTNNRTQTSSTNRAVRSSVPSALSPELDEAHIQTTSPQIRSMWVSSTPHLSGYEKTDPRSANRTCSNPCLPRSESETLAPAFCFSSQPHLSFESNSTSWDPYSGGEGVYDKRSSYGSDSSSGLVVPGVLRDSTLSDVTDSYIFDEYAYSKHDSQNSGRDAAGSRGESSISMSAYDASHYQNVSVIKSQPLSSRLSFASDEDVDNKAIGSGLVGGQPRQASSVQIYDFSRSSQVMTVHRASQTSCQSFIEILDDHYRDVTHGLPVFEDTFEIMHDPVYGSSRPTGTNLRDNTQSCVTHAHHSHRPNRRRATRVRFSEGQNLTEMADDLSPHSEVDPNSPGLRNITASTLATIGTGVRELVRIFHVPFQCCRSGRQETARPSEPRVVRHSFRSYHFRRPHRCFVCLNMVYDHGSACQVCRYICHSTCESRVMTSCVSSGSDAVNKNQASKISNVIPSQTHSTLSSSTMRDMLNKSHEQSQMEGPVTLDVVHITNRIISMTFPSDGHDTSYVFNLNEALRVLRSKHGDHFLIVNLSEKHPELVKAHPQVKEFGWPDHLAPPLERLCLICKAIDTWLSTDIRHIVIFHCKGGRSRLASVVAAYMHYNNICASAGQAVDSLAMKQYYDEKLGGLPLPSQRRYVAYFSGLLSGAIKINSQPLYLHHILIHGVPDFDNRGGCCPFIKVYQSMQPIFTSGVYNVTDNMQKVCISITPGIPLRGDILIKCYHKNARSGQKEVIWQCQFHTCAITGNQVVYSKQELDDAVLDPRFPDSGKVQFVFGSSSDVLVSVTGFKSDITVPIVDSEESMVRTDSYEEFNKVSGLAVDAFDFNKNRILSPPAPGGSTHIPQHMGSVDHHRAPDGSLYATVTRRDLPPHSSAANSGSVHLTNGSIASSLDSGHRGHDASFNSHLTPAAVANNNINSSSSSISPSYSSTQQSSQRTVQTCEERMQLDDLLSNLLSDQVYVSPTKDSSRSVPGQSQQAGHLSSAVASGDSITISPGMNSAKTVTTTTRTFTTYSATDAHRNPDNVLIQRSEVSYKVPGQGEVRDHYTDMPDAASSKPTPAYHPKGVPPNAFSYTSNTSNSQRADFVQHDIIRNPPEQGLQSPPSSQLTYYPRFEPRLAPSSSSQPVPSPDGVADSWLTQQQQKLKSFKEGRDPSGHSEQEKKLMTELQFAQNKYYTHVTQNTVEEKPITDTYSRQPLHNGPTFTEGLAPPYTVPQRSESSSRVDGQWQDQFYNTSYSTSSYLESQSFADKQSHRPPPSPIMQRSMPASSGPLPVPARSSSKEFMRTFSNSSSSNWQQNQRPLQRQHSETLYDRTAQVEAPRRYESAHNTPPQSPPLVASPLPSGPANTTTYTAYRTMERQKESQNDLHPAKVLQDQQLQGLPSPQPPAQVSHHYVTEVFVHRSDANKDKMDAVTHLEELEKNLEAASQSIKTSQQQVVRQAPPQQRFEESVSHISHQYQTYQESVSREESSLHRTDRSMTQSRSQSPPVWDNVDAPEPPRVKEIEEDRIILRPIGPGVQTLEPENIHTATLGRPSTPGFPTAPGGGQQIVGPAGTLQSSSHHQQQQQQQQQTMQYQQYQAQQYQTQTLHHDGQGQNTLHIDTSPRMIYPSQSPSAGSPPSPGNFNTFRQQMSESVGSLGPHSVTGQSSPSVYYGLSRRGSLSSLTDSDMVHATPKFVKDTSKYWYKPNISREDAIQLLRDKHPGSFVIRDSNSFPGAYGLALKVATLPPNVQAKSSSDPQADLVRHFLIEPTPKGVRLRGCSNEPLFGSLAALVYQHSITPLALPGKLVLPEPDGVHGMNIAESLSATEVSSASTLLAQGAACNVIYVNSVDVESLTGPQAIAKAVKTTFENLVQGRTTMVHFKVFSEGITLTDNNRKLFFRRHYPVSAVTYCGMDPQDRRWKREVEAPGGLGDARLFGFVARKQGSTNENTCHIFAELDPEQPASAIVNFVTKVMIGQKN